MVAKKHLSIRMDEELHDKIKKEHGTIDPEDLKK